MSTMIDKLNDILTEKTTKIIPENIKNGVTVFGVNGNLKPGSNGAKLFNTVLEMNADQDKTVNDIAVVYNENIVNWREDTESNVIIFPREIQLDTPIDQNAWYYGNFRGYDETTGDNVDMSLEINRTRCRVQMYNSGEELRFEYTSQDGQNFSTENAQNINLPLEIKFDSEGMGQWNDVIGYFCQTRENNFEGLYKCESDEIIHKNHIINLIKLNTINYDSQTGINAEKGTKQVTENEINMILNKTKFYSENYKTCSIFYINGKYYIMPFYHDESFYMFLIYSNVTKKVSLVCSKGNVYDYTKDPSEIFIYDPVNDSVEYKTTANYNTSAGSWGAGPYNLYLITEVNTTDNDYGLFYYSDKHVLKNVSMLYCLSNEYPTQRDWSSFSIDNEYLITYENNYHKYV